MIAEFGPELDVDGKEAGQLLFAVDDPVPAVRVVLLCQPIAATEKRPADTAGPAVEDGLTFSAQQFATCVGNHVSNPSVSGPRPVPRTSCADRRDRGVIARLRVACLTLESYASATEKPRVAKL